MALLGSSQGIRGLGFHRSSPSHQRSGLVRPHLLSINIHPLSVCVTKKEDRSSNRLTVQWRLPMGGRLIIMAGTKQMEWHQTHGNHVFDVFDTIPLIPLQSLPQNPFSPNKLPPTSFALWQLLSTLLYMYGFCYVASCDGNMGVALSHWGPPPVL